MKTSASTEATKLLFSPDFFEGNLHQLAKDFSLIALGLEGLCAHAEHEDDITTDQINSIIDYACNLHGKLCVLAKTFPEMLAAARSEGHTKGGAA